MSDRTRALCRSTNQCFRPTVGPSLMKAISYRKTLHNLVVGVGMCAFGFRLARIPTCTCSTHGLNVSEGCCSGGL